MVACLPWHSERHPHFFEKCFNWILKIDGRCHLVIVLSELSWVYETISLFQMHEDLKG
jgi:hypothetical protein